MPRTATVVPRVRPWPQVVGAIALLAALAAPALAAAPAEPDRSGVTYRAEVAPFPADVDHDALETALRARLDVLRVALEAYANGHGGRYPHASDPRDLQAQLAETWLLPDGFDLAEGGVEVVGFRCDPGAYALTLRAGDLSATAASPRRYSAFWGAILGPLYR